LQCAFRRPRGIEGSVNNGLLPKRWIFRRSV
jgi:hypothetical protein